ncbi:MAG: PTS ascorbate transporter subunit IIC [Lachnospiraceae bacterium]|nr:PTS ascorbate transporter subunit IIC [Lachnospiraceae bacterium]
MLQVLKFIQSILSTPSIFVGILALIGLIIQKESPQNCIKGTIKTILGFVILGAGADVVQQAIIPFGDLFQVAFHVEGVVPNNEAITALALNQYAFNTASIFALAMVFNIILARLSNLKFIFLTGHHTLYMSCLVAILFSIAGMQGAQLVVSGSLLMAFLMVFFPAIMQPTMKKITGENNLAIGHFGSGCYWLSAQIGKLFANDKKKVSTEDIKFSQGLSFLRENTVSISIAMFLCYIVIATIAEVKVPTEAAPIFGDNNFVVYSILQSIKFSAGIYIVLAGVRMLINEIVPAFKGISEKVVPNAIPALDCPIVFPFAPNAVLIGFLSSFVGGILAMLVLAFASKGVNALPIILPGVVLHFFCGGTAGVAGNANGGLKGCIFGSFVHGVVATFLAAGLFPILADLGFRGTTFADTDFTLVGIIFGNLAKMKAATLISIICVVLYVLPILCGLLFSKKQK